MKKLIIAIALLSAVNRGLCQQYVAAPADSHQLNAEHANAAKKQGPAKDNSQPQILLRLRVYEVSRAKLQNLGFDFAGISSAPAAADAEPAAADAESLEKVIKALHEVGVASILSEPVVATLNNQQASVRVGDNARVAVSAGFGKWRIEDQFCGTSADFTPVVLDDHKIRVKLHFEKSSLNMSQRVTAGSETVPTVDRIELETQVECTPGKTVSLGGLVVTCDSSKPADAAETAGKSPQAGADTPPKDTGKLTLFFLTPEIVAPTTTKTAATIQTRR